MSQSKELEASRLGQANMSALREALQAAGLPADDLDAPDVTEFAGDDALLRPASAVLMKKAL